MHNPDGMIPTYSPDMPAAYKFAHQRPSSGPCDSVSTSVRDLIDSAIEDALTNTPDLNGKRILVLHDQPIVTTHNL